MYVRREAVLSSQIEGTQASLTDVLRFEVGTDRDAGIPDVEVVNYVAAMNYGLQRHPRFKYAPYLALFEDSEDDDHGEPRRVLHTRSTSAPEG
jgi:Fic family protein